MHVLTNQGSNDKGSSAKQQDEEVIPNEKEQLKQVTRSSEIVE